jgi:hypothetical protein
MALFYERVTDTIGMIIDKTIDTDLQFVECIDEVAAELK